MEISRLTVVPPASRASAFSGVPSHPSPSRWSARSCSLPIGHASAGPFGPLQGTAACAVLCAWRMKGVKCHREAMARCRRSSTDIVPDGTIMGDRPKVRYIWQVPQAASPELVLAGRSNAGKSTLLNAVLGAAGMKKAAPMSPRGGRTRTLNWYPIGFRRPLGWYGDGVRIPPEWNENEDLSLEDELRAAGEGCCLVDCFGLGEVDYSELKARRLQTWGPLLQKFLSERRALQTFCHLISSEQEGQLSDGDRQLVDIFDRSEAERDARGFSPVRYVVVLTKIDLFDPSMVSEFQERLSEAFAQLGRPPSSIVSCASLRYSGIRDFQRVVGEAAGRGWDQLDQWILDATKLQRTPQGRSNFQRQQVKAAYTSTAKQSARRPARGGKGASTMMPPSV